MELSFMEDYGDGDEPMHPKDASRLSQEDLHKELQAHDIQPTGHPQDNLQLLQDKYDEEFRKSQEGRTEYLEKRKKADQARKKRAMYEAQHVEEMEALARDPKLEVWYNLAQENQTPQNACLRDLSKVTCRAVARVLAQNSSLLSLDISRSDLGDEAGLHLAEMLKTNRRLLKLEVERNGFGPATIKAFGDALTFNNTLTFLSVENNPLTVSRSDDRQHDFTGVEHFAKTLESNSSLTSLNMFCTQMSMEGGRALAKGLLANSNLIVMDVGNNNVGVKELEIITEKLEKNKNQREMSDRIRREQRKESQRVAEERRKQHEAARKAKDQEEWHNDQAAQREKQRQADKEEFRIAEAERIEAEREAAQKAKEEADRKAAEAASKKGGKKKKKKK